MNRKHFIKTVGVSLGSMLLYDDLFGNASRHSFIAYPDKVMALINSERVQLIGKDKQSWVHETIAVDLKKKEDHMLVTVEAPNCTLNTVVIIWKKNTRATAILNDHWERTYGDVSWHNVSAAEILPWYFMEHTGNITNGFGVKTGAGAFCYWQVGSNELTLTLDTTSGGDGVRLGTRKLHAAEIVTLQGNPNETTFVTTRNFTKLMCNKPRLPKAPVYGINDWYFSYGNNSEKLILEHTRLMAPMADGLINRPFSVIDAGWFIGSPSSPNDCCWGDRMDIANTKFGHMSKSAANIKKEGMRPGIWTRPLCGSYKDNSSLILPMINGREPNKPVLDPSIPENIERIKTYFSNYRDWGYEMVKFDFTTFDIMGKWGFEMLKTGSLTVPGWRMHDNSKTNAEIIKNMYTAIRDAAGATYIIGCNTISHLSAGLFELNRIGDDTSGNEWQRTRTMGVNTLAFRGVQHGTFYAADADCVGLTTKVPWDKNRQWMELVAKSGTPLFISAQSNATGAEQKQTIKDCFEYASKQLPLAEPLDWMTNALPAKWKLNGAVQDFDWI